MKTSLRRRVASAALLVAVPLVGACGFGYETDQQYQPSTGTDNRQGQVYILNAVVVTEHGRTGTFAGTLVNESQTSADKLVAVTGPGVQGSTTQVALPPNQAVDLAKSGNVTVSGPDIKPGYFVTLTLEFASGQSTQMDVPVVLRTGDYANVPAPSSPSPSPSPSPKHKPKNSPSSSPSASVSSPSASPSSTG